MEELHSWLEKQVNARDFKLCKIHCDASFRTYYRLSLAQHSYILMVAPPDKEPSQPFVSIAKSWLQQGIKVPEIFAWNPTKGWLLLSDFGDTLLAEVLRSNTVNDYYQQGMNLILKIQDTTLPKDYSLPVFDPAFIKLELGYFREWCLSKLLEINFRGVESTLLIQLEQMLVDNALSQPVTVIHRDFHSRNLLVHEDSLAVIDFQDAMLGPITYDLVSLIKDCYVTWPSSQVTVWMANFYNYLQAENKINNVDLATFIKWCDLMGLQRHLKVLGIFSRLNLRDGKSRYLQDMPRILSYVFEVTERYPELSDLDAWLKSSVKGRFIKYFSKTNVDTVSLTA